MKIRALLFTLCFLLNFVLLGCTTMNEASKGFMGISTKVLDDGRKDAKKQSFNIYFGSCYNKVKSILKKNDAYIYAEDPTKRMIAIYVSNEDTTPVGLYFTEEANSKTLIEVSSPSTYAKEKIANLVFSGIEKPINPKTAERKPDAQGITVSK